MVFWDVRNFFTFIRMTYSYTDIISYISTFLKSFYDFLIFYQICTNLIVDFRYFVVLNFTYSPHLYVYCVFYRGNINKAVCGIYAIFYKI